MLLRTSGRLAPDLYLLGTIKNPIFLTGSGDEWTLIEGGLTWMSPLILRQIDEVLPSRRYVRHWLITHAHYDHCAMLGQLYAEMPWLRVHAGPATARALTSARARGVVHDLNAQVLALPGHEQGTAPAPPAGGLAAPVPAEAVPVEVVKDGETILLDRGRTVRVIETPGHSRCSTTFFDEHAGRAVVSDALGEMVDEHLWCPLAFDDLESYRRSITKIRELGAGTVLLAHHAALTERHAQLAPQEAREALDVFARDAARLVAEHEGDDEAAARAMSRRFHSVSAAFVPEALHAASMRRMIDLLRAEGQLIPST
jgi:glyoxylase-like metal-dependent hydrolase (beta-lactamase superfamily II)